jgi:hypothetical protein
LKVIIVYIFCGCYCTDEEKNKEEPSKVKVRGLVSASGEVRESRNQPLPPSIPLYIGISTDRGRG